MKSNLHKHLAQRNLRSFVEKLSGGDSKFQASNLVVKTPITGQAFASVTLDDANTINNKIEASKNAFNIWKNVPAPKRGEFIKILGREITNNKSLLASLITHEAGKIILEAEGEVQEMIDICDYAVGLSRMIGGHTFPSERKNHTLNEYWYPLGPVGVISAFNFPAAVLGWNREIALVCGNSVIHKPSEKTPLTALACQSIFEEAAKKARKNGIFVPPHLSQVIIGGKEAGELLVNDNRIPLISATGSTNMGRHVGEQVARRFGKSILELGGNNAAVITDSADLSVALPSIIFGAVGTAGQRCTTTRRLFVPENMYKEVMQKLQNAYKQVNENDKVGDPRAAQTLVGPLIDLQAAENMEKALKQAAKEKGTVYYGGRALEKDYPDAGYVYPAFVAMKEQSEIVKKETFAPILYVMKYRSLSQVIEMVNDVPQGLSASIFTKDISYAEKFKKEVVTGIVNVNTGTSGAEIGGAFGGEKETGGGRESGSNSWQQYMRRTTSTTYFGKGAPTLAQGVKFDIEK
jgi:aldehyde dehydrogenase (NAD+)